MNLVQRENDFEHGGRPKYSNRSQTHHDLVNQRQGHSRGLTWVMTTLTLCMTRHRAGTDPKGHTIRFIVGSILSLWT